MRITRTSTQQEVSKRQNILNYKHRETMKANRLLIICLLMFLGYNTKLKVQEQVLLKSISIQIDQNQALINTLHVLTIGTGEAEILAPAAPYTMTSGHGEACSLRELISESDSRCSNNQYINKNIKISEHGLNSYFINKRCRRSRHVDIKLLAFTLECCNRSVIPLHRYSFVWSHYVNERRPSLIIV